MEYSERAVTLRTGTCPSCAKEFAYVEGSTLSHHLPSEPEGPRATPVGAPIVVEEEAPECEECGTPLAFRTGRGGAILAVCSECESTTIYRPASESRRGGGESPYAGRDRGPPGGPRSRPCRRCGAPLRFTTGEDGLLVGECESCGNRFTLPPRAGPPGERGSGGRPSYGRTGYRSRDRRGSPYRSSGRQRTRTYSDEDRREGPPRDEDLRRRRRRPRDE